MWFFFGIFTLIASTVWGVELRLAANWRGRQHFIGKDGYFYQEARRKGNLNLVRLGVRAPAGLNFRVRIERGHDRFFKWLGVATEIQTRDADFDRELYVESDARAVAILLKRDAKVRSALLNIFAYAQTRRLKKMRLRCASGRVWVEFKPESERDLSLVRNHLAPLLWTIAAAFESVDLPAEYRRDRFARRAAVALAFSTGTLLLGAYGLVRSFLGPTDILDPYLLLLACSVPALLLTAGGVVVLLGWLAASSRTHTVILEFTVAGGLGLLLGTYALAREANMEFDFHAANQVITAIRPEIRAAGRRGRQSWYYYLHCPDWRTGREGETLRIEVDASTYWPLSHRNEAAIYLKPGLLGFAWVEKIEPVKRAAPSR